MVTSERLRTLRTDRTNTQSEIAALIGCSRVSYIDYESGRRDVPLKGLLILADYYRVSSDFLLGLTVRRSPYPTLQDVLGELAPCREECPVCRILKELRCGLGLTQQEVAKCIDCTQAGYCSYESGRRSIPAGIIIKLSGFYNVSTDYLLGRTYSKRINN